jgi:nucleoside-diphosphate-sugar epimerase
MTAPARLVLITGATGAVGPSVVRAFHEAGFRVRTYSLDPPDSGLFPAGVETIVGDIGDAEGVSAAMRGAGGVVHMAAILHRDDPPPDLRPVYERSNVGGTASVVAAGLREGVGRIVLFSTIAVYGAGNGAVLTENSEPRPQSLYARTKRDAENIVLAARDTTGRPAGTVLRLGAVYGPRIKGHYRRLARSLARGRFFFVGDGGNRRTLIQERDVAAAAVLAIEHPGAAGRAFNVTDGVFHTVREIVTVLSGLLGRRVPRVVLPVAWARAAAGVIEFGARRLGKEPPVTRGMIDKLVEDVAVSGDRLIGELGFAPSPDLEKGWAEVLEGMRRSGEPLKDR